MKIHQLSVADALLSLHSQIEGLSSQEAARRLEEYGPNQVDTVQEHALGWAFVKEFTHFFALILWVAAGLAFFAEAQAPGQGMQTLGAAIVGVIFINGVFTI